MILLTKRLCLATLVILSVAAVPRSAQSQTCADCAGYEIGSHFVEADAGYAEVGSSYAEVGAEYSEAGLECAEVSSDFAEVGEAGAYFEQAASCQCQQSGRDCGRRSGRLRSIVRALRPFGDSGCYESYRSVFGGWAEVEDDGGNPVSSGLEFNEGFLLGTAKGIYLNNNTRIERESSWRNNSVEGLDVGIGTIPLDGRVNNFSTMVNVIRDFRTDSRLQPYVGFGAGASRLDGEFTDGTIDLEVDDWAVAYQGFAGLRFVKSCRVSLFAEYRYFGNSDTDLEATFGGGRSFDVADFEYTAENILFGIQFKR